MNAESGFYPSGSSPLYAQDIRTQSIPPAAQHARVSIGGLGSEICN